MDGAFFIDRVKFLILLLLSLTVHEFCHAWSAWKLGDDTAANAGRLTLNPIPHIDLMGTILLPLMGFPLGWAKPVPVQPQRFRRGVRMGVGDSLVSVAGPLANFALGLAAAVVLGALWRFAPETVVPGRGVSELLVGLMQVNAALMVFNLIPVPPLDGGHVAANLVPYRYRPAWDRFARFSPLLLLAIVFFGWRFIAPPVMAVTNLLASVTQLIAG